MTRPPTPLPWLPVLAILVAGLALRIAAARGGLWLDEAWSAVFAADVGTPAGVFLNIHHDNNHHLNTLWLQWVGIGAPPIVQRALSIASGTAAILVAAMIVAPRGRSAAIVATSLFAVSPILVTYGSEARGYAPMLLAFLLTVLIVGRSLDAPHRPVPALGLGVLALLGTLAQMTFVFGLCAVAGWVATRRWQQDGLRTAAIDSARVIAVPMVVTIATIGAIVRWLPGAEGFRIGSYFPFTFRDLAIGQRDMLVFTLGLPSGSGWVLAVTGVSLAGLALLPALKSRRILYLLALVGVPLGCAAVQLGNVAIARYFLVGSAAVLLLVSDVFAIAFSRRGVARVMAIAGLATILTGSAWRNMAFLGDLRADPAKAMADMQLRAPRGTTVSLDRERAAPVMRVAAAHADYRIRIEPCARFLFVDRDGTEAFPARPMHCLAPYAPIARGDPSGLSGTHWTLYERRP